jgi:hypothetical protein
MPMSEQGKMGWIIGLFVVVLGMTGVAAYVVQQNQSLRITLNDAKTALTVAQQQRDEAQERANVPAVAAAIALLPEAPQSTLREVTEVATGVYRVWRSVPAQAADTVHHEWWRVEAGNKKATKVDETSITSTQEPGLLRATGAEGREVLSYAFFAHSEELAPVYAQTWTKDGELESVVDAWGTQARLRVPGQEGDVTLRLAAANGATCTPSSKTLPLAALDIVRGEDEAVTVAVAPPVLLACAQGVPTGSPWSSLVTTAAAAENTQTPGAPAVWRLPLASVGERDRYLEINPAFEPTSLFVR